MFLKNVLVNKDYEFIHLCLLLEGMAGERSVVNLFYYMHNTVQVLEPTFLI